MQVLRDGADCTITLITEPVFVPGTFAPLILDQVESGDRRLTLDLSHIEMLHSPGLAELTRIYVHLQKRGVELVLTGLNGFNRRLLSNTRLDCVIHILED